MCQKSFSTLAELSEIQDFVSSLAISISEHTLLDIGLLCFELSQNSLQHGGSPTVEIQADSARISITDFDSKLFNPLTAPLGGVRSQGLRYLNAFREKHSSITLSHEYLEGESSNVFSISIPVNENTLSDKAPCSLIISGMIATRYSSELEEQLRKLGHCTTVVITINYGFMAYSIMLPSFEAILRATYSREQKIIIRTTPGDLIKDALVSQLERISVFEPRFKATISIQ